MPKSLQGLETTSVQQSAVAPPVVGNREATQVEWVVDCVGQWVFRRGRCVVPFPAVGAWVAGLLGLLG